MISKICSAIKIGFSSGVKRAFNPELKGYELDLDSLTQQVQSQHYSDNDVVRLFREFCRKHDSNIEMSGTNNLLKLIIVKRPNIKGLI